MRYLAAVLGISLLIVLHELGHYLVARACGMRVLRFSLGFGPPIWRRMGSETIWQIAAIPLGGFVQIHGMGPPDPEAPGDDARSYRSRPIWQRALVMVAGPIANWLLAAAFITLLAGSIGFKYYDPRRAELGDVDAERPAAAAGLLPGDRIESVAGIAVSTWPELVAQIEAHPQETIDLRVRRGEQSLELRVTPDRTKDGRGQIGVEPPSEVVRHPPLEAVGTGFSMTWRASVRMLDLLWGMVRGSGEGQLSGVPEIMREVSRQASRGIRDLLTTLALLSVSLSILNLLPIPALDGGRLLFLGVEAVRRKRMNEKLEATIHGVGFLLVLLLVIAVSIRDLL